MANLTKREILSRVEYFKENDRHGKVFMPNEIFEMLSKHEGFKGKNSKNIAEAYCFMYLISWLYRNAKYGWMQSKHSDIGGLKEIIGLSADNKGFNYVVKKGGILDDLELTRTLSFKEAPFQFTWEDGMLEFQTQEELDAEKDERQLIEEKLVYKTSSRNKTFKYPVFGLEREGEYGVGTFFGYVENTHHVDFQIFVECMANPKLGCVAFCIYSLLSHKCDVAGGTIEIGGSTITNRTGITETLRKKALKGLKEFRLINCYPAPFVVGGDQGEGANVYSVNSITIVSSTPQPYIKCKLIPAENQDKDKKKSE